MSFLLVVLWVYLSFTKASRLANVSYRFLFNEQAYFTVCVKFPISYHINNNAAGIIITAKLTV